MADETLTADERAELDAFRAAKAEAEALADKQAAEQAAAEAAAREEAAAVSALAVAEAAARTASPGEYVGLDPFGSGVYAYQAVPGREFQREISVGGQPYHHVDTDADGVWLYRRGA